MALPSVQGDSNEHVISTVSPYITARKRDKVLEIFNVKIGTGEKTSIDQKDVA